MEVDILFSILWCTSECNALWKKMAGTWFYATLVDWILKCGRCTQKWRHMNELTAK